MKFFRLISVFLCCALLSSFLILPASAADDDNYYSVPAVSDGSALVAPASLGGLALASSGEYSSQLSTIITHLSTNNSYLSMIYSYMTGLAQWRNSLETNTSTTNTLLSSISNKISGFATESTLSAISDKVATEPTLKAFSDSFSSFAPLNSEWPGDPISFGSYFSKIFAVTTNPALIGEFSQDKEKGFIFNVWANPVEGSISSRVSAHVSWSGFISTLLADLVFDGNQSSFMGGGPTIYRMLHLLQDTLASEDDRQLADNYKENREQAETDFLSGKSGKTSLGKDDFGSLSSVGGTFKDTISLNGQSSIGDLTSGLSDADTVGQGWFSQATKDSLDAVSASSSSESTVSTFSDDGLTSVDVDPDPYHMQGFEDNYAWLWGDDDG